MKVSFRAGMIGEYPIQLYAPGAQVSRRERRGWAYVSGWLVGDIVGEGGPVFRPKNIFYLFPFLIKKKFISHDFIINFLLIIIIISYVNTNIIYAFYKYGGMQILPACPYVFFLNLIC